MFKADRGGSYIAAYCSGRECDTTTPNLRQLKEEGDKKAIEKDKEQKVPPHLFDSYSTLTIRLVKSTQKTEYTELNK